MTPVDPKVARMFVADLPDIGTAKSDSARRKAAKKAAAERVGNTIISITTPRAVEATMRSLMKRTGMRRDQLLAEGLHVLQTQLEHKDMLSAHGLAALEILMRQSGGRQHDVIDFALRFTLQELRRRRSVRLD